MTGTHGRAQPTGVAEPAEPVSAREPVDLRLAVGACAAWIAVLVCVNRSAGAVVGMGLVAATGAAGLLATARHGPRVAPALALALSCVALVLLPLAGRIEHARASPLALLARRRAAVTVTLTTTGDPAVLAATGPAGAPRVEVAAQALTVARGGVTTPTDGTLLVLADASSWRGLLPGQRVRVDGTLAPDLGGGSLSVTLFARPPPVLIGRPPWAQRLAGRIRAALRRASAGLPAQERGLLPGLVDGDTANLDPVLAQRFRDAGLTHLVAVSGTNCSIVLGAVILLLRRARVRPWLRAVLGFGVLLVFVLVARPSPSVLRAALMAAVALVSLAFGRPAAAVPSLAAVVLGLLLWNPALAASASFAMSVLATAALLLIAPSWARRLRARRLPAGIAESVAVAAAAHVITAPVVAAISGRVSIVAVPANVLAEPVVAVTTIIGFVAAVVAPWWPGAGAALCQVAGWPCRWLVGVADFFGGVHGAAIRWPGGVLGALALLAVLLTVALAALRTGLRRVLLAAALTALVIAMPVRSATSSWPPPGWLFVACDVGQGDALLLNAGAGSAVEIDAGPDPVAIDRCLRDLDVTRIPLLIFSHFHLDHVGGLVGVVRGRTVGRVLAGPLNEPLTGSRIVHHVFDPRGVVVQTPAVGAVIGVGAVSLTVLGPASAFHGTRSDPNNSSLVLRAVVGGVRILLTGDAEIEAQQAMLDSGVDLRADVLKVPHHGSAYSDPAFLAAVHAQLAVVSVGLHNDYGQPSPVLLNEMARLDVPLLRTDRDGDVAVVRSSGRLTAVVHGVAQSTVALGPGVRGAAQRSAVPTGRSAAVGAAISLSGAGARMGGWQRDRSNPTTCPTRCPGSCSSSVTKTCSSTGPSARSPPPPAAATRRCS